MKKGILPNINPMKRDKLQNINPLYQNLNKKMLEYQNRAHLDWKENIEKEKDWNKNFSKFNSLSKPVKPSMLASEPYQKSQHYQLRGNNREEEEKKFREINRKNLEHYNKKLAKQQKEELSKLSKFYREATQRIKLPIIPNRLNMIQKPDYAEGRELEYQQELLSSNKKPSKEKWEDFNNNLKIENANYKYLKKFKSNKKKCWQIEYEKQNRQVKQAKELLSKLEEKDIDNYLDSM